MREKISKLGKMLLCSMLMCLVMAIHTEAAAGKAEIEDNDSFASANEMDVNTEYTGNLQTYSDIDYYKVVLTEPGSLYANLRILDDNSNYWNVTLYKEDSDLNRIEIKTWTAGSMKNTIFTKYRFPAGVYYLKVTAYSDNRWYSSAEYMLTANFTAESVDAYEVEENDTLETANSIQTNHEYTGNIHSETDKDYYKFVLDENSHIQLKFIQVSEPGDGVYWISLYRLDESGTLVLYDRKKTTNDITNYGNSSDLPAGTYVLLVKYGKQLKAENDYKINLVQTPVTDSVIEEDIPDTIYGSVIAVNNEMELNDGTYTFHLPEQGRIVFDENDKTDQYTLYRIDEKGNEEYIGSPYALDVIRIGKGDYSIKVDHLYSSITETVRINYIQESPYNTETESNDNFSTTNIIELDREYTGNIESRSDEDYYKFTLLKRGVLSVNLRNTLKEGSARWTITLYKEENDGNRTEIEKQSVGYDKMSEIGKRRLDAGTYYIKVSCYGSWSKDSASDYYISASFRECVNFDEAQLSAVSSQTYTGDEITPGVIVNFRGTQLTNGTDYTISYKNNVNAGTATIQITGEDIYEGVKTVDFVINKATQNIITDENYNFAYNNTSYWNLKLNVKLSGAGTLTYESANPEIASVDAYGNITPKADGVATVIITANETENYAEAKKLVTVNIYKKEQSIEVPQSFIEKTIVDAPFALNAYTTGDGALVYTSSNPAVATVDGNGQVTPTGDGITDITIVATEGEQYAQSDPVIVTIHIIKPTAEIGKKYIDDTNTAWYVLTSDNTVTYVIEDKYKEVVTIPDTITIYGDTYMVTKIESGSFYEDDVIEKVKLGKNITSIGKSAFEGAVNLKSITLNKNLKTIGVRAFYNCQSLTKITIPDKVTIIGDKAFAYCTKMSKATIGKGVTKIGKSAFYGDKKLKTITIKSSKVSSIGKKAFAQIYTKAKITVPKKKLAAYKKKIKSSGIAAGVTIKK